jgi:plastocyanin
MGLAAIRSVSARSRSIGKLALLLVLLPLLSACTMPMFFQKGSENRFTVVMTSDRTFDPASLVISQGATVVWWNQSVLPHTTTLDPGAFDSDIPLALPDGANPWNSDVVLSGQFWSTTFDTPGDYLYACQYHAELGMVGTIRVEQ